MSRGPPRTQACPTLCAIASAPQPNQGSGELCEPWTLGYFGCDFLGQLPRCGIRGGKPPLQPAANFFAPFPDQEAGAEGWPGHASPYEAIMAPYELPFRCGGVRRKYRGPSVRTPSNQGGADVLHPLQVQYVRCGTWAAPNLGALQMAPHHSWRATTILDQLDQVPRPKPPDSLASATKCRSPFRGVS